MKEAFLHHIWQMKLFDVNLLTTTHGSLVEIVNFGKLNKDAGPDFIQAEIVIGNQLWVGNVEMHVNSSDWDLHQHSKDKAYHNVILHVVWNHDTEIDFLRSRNIENLVLQDYVDKAVIFNYESILAHQSTTIPCANLIQHTKIDWEKLTFWFNGLLVDRLQEKSKTVLALYEHSLHHWEEVAFKLIASNFGLKVNQDVFEIWSNSFPFSVLQKVQHQPNYVEALFFGQADFLTEVLDDYTNQLQKDYLFLKHKYQLKATENSSFKFYNLRPQGFPTIRLAQLSAIYSSDKSIFSKIISFKTIKEIEEYFKQFEPNEYWKNHYVFGKESKVSNKIISKEKIHNLIINTIIPLRFSYDLTIDKLDVELYIDLLSSLKAETNSVVDLFYELKFPLLSAKDSQAVLQLKKCYCDEKKCLNCALGNEVLKP